MILLFITELTSYMQVEVTSDMYVDDQKQDSKKLQVSFNITIHSLPCGAVSVDAQDILGNHAVRD